MKMISAIFMAVMLLASHSEAQPRQQKVLVIQSYHSEMPWVQQCEKGIRDILGSKYQLTFFYLDTKRLPKAEFQKRADAAWAVYMKSQPDLVMIGDDNGLKLLGPKFSATDTPIIYFGINNNPRKYFEKLPENITGVLERVPLFPWIRHIHTIIPFAKKALVLFDQSPTTDSILQVTFMDRHIVSVNGIEIGYAMVGNWSEWQTLVANLDGYDFVIMPTFHSLKNGADRHIDVDRVIQWSSDHSPVPLFSHQDYTVGPKGTVGAYVIFGEAHGRLAGNMALDILEGRKTAREIQTQMDKDGKFYFNRQQLSRFHLELPEKIERMTTYR